MRCQTIGCTAPATVHLTYVYRGEQLADSVCGPCADSYSRRPALAILTRDDVTTWADGLGRWHASVPLALTGVPASTDPADVRRMLARASRIARTAIRSELDARGISSAYRMRVKRTHLTVHGTAHYREA